MNVISSHVVQKLLAKQGLPDSDDYSLPSSTLTFDDGGHYKIEISGVESFTALEELISATDESNVTVHRIIAFVGGATLVDRAELRAVAECGRDRQMEVIVVPGPRASWDMGRQAVSPEGKKTGGRVRGADNFYYLLRDYERMIDCGLRGFLVWDEGTLDVLSTARTSGDVPADVVLKASTYMGHGNPAAIRLLERLGADSVNPVVDLSRPMLAAIRRATSVPLDLFACVFDSFGGTNRMWEAGEIARVAAPCYLKIEPGLDEASVYSGNVSASAHEVHVREKVRLAEIIEELIAEESKGEVRSAGVAKQGWGIPV